jgi:lipopolysaccharide/colanic/teichoic acid biosynthesis glycosyltransferase
MRRLFDVLCAAAGLVFLCPLFAVIALAIKLEDGGAVFFRHPRVGKKFQKFGLLKFRSMVPDAEKLGGPVTSAGDPRVTRVGGWLRRYKLDELPQLVNVLKGEMALVGARPEVERYVELFRSPYAAILRDPPGITDPAALAFRHEEDMLRSSDTEEQYVREILPSKLELSLEYSQRRTFRSDLGIVFRTLLGICWTPRPLARLSPQHGDASETRTRPVSLPEGQLSDGAPADLRHSGKIVTLP